MNAKTLCHSLLLFVLLFPAFAWGAPQEGFEVNYYFEDDYPFSIWFADRAYTFGTRLSVLQTSNTLPSLLTPFLGKLAGPKSEFNFGFAFGQQLYTPENISRADYIPDDEPYAGYLHVAGIAHIRNGDTLHSFELDLGWVGPSALGKETQTVVHELIKYKIPNGWANQIHDEPTVALFYQQKRNLWDLKTENGMTLIDLVPSVSGALGNLYIYAGAGAQARAGYALSDDFGPNTITPLGVDSFVTKQRAPWEAYAFLSADARWMVRNLFLDGNTFRSSPRIDKKPFVYDVDFGFLIRVGDFKLLWRQVVRSPEFETVLGAHKFASVCLTYTKLF